MPYWEWEDWKAGMWGKVDKQEEIKMLKCAIEFTGNHYEYGNAMREVVKMWPKTMLNSLTNVSINRRAFLGHCAVCYKFGIPEYIVRMAWKELSDKQRILADNEAQTTINKWELQNRELQNTCKPGREDVMRVGFQTKLQLK